MFQSEDDIRDGHVTGVQTCALPIWFFIYPGFDKSFKSRKIIHSSRYALRRSIPRQINISIQTTICHRNSKRSEERRVGKDYAMPRNASTVEHHGVDGIEQTYGHTSI